MKKIELKLNPLTDNTESFDFSPGDNLEEKVKEILESKGIKEEVYEGFLVLVNGHEIEKDLWNTVVLEEGDIVLISPKIAGGDFGQTFKQVAITVVAVAASAAFPPASVGILGSAAIVAGATIGATLLLNSLIPPPEPGGLGGLGSGTGSQESSQMYNIAGQSNQAKRYGSVPKVYGTFNFYPNVAALPYTDVEADLSTGNTVQTFYAIYDFGLGPTYIEEIKIGDTPITEFDDVQYNLVDPNRPDTNEGVWDEGVNKEFKLYKGDYNIEDVGYEFVKNSNDFGAQLADYQVIRNTAVNSTNLESEINLNFSFPAGLISFSKFGSRGDVRVEFGIQFRKVGDTTWRNYNDFDYVSSFFVGAGLSSSESTRLTSYPFTTSGPFTFFGEPTSFEGPTNSVDSDYEFSITRNYLEKFRGYNQKWGYPKGTDTFIIKENQVTVSDTFLYFNSNPIGKIIAVAPSSTYPGYDEVTIDEPIDADIIVFNRVRKKYNYPSLLPTTYEVTQQFYFQVQKAVAGQFSIVAETDKQYFSSLKFTPRETGQFEIKVTRIKTVPTYGYSVRDRAVLSNLVTRLNTVAIDTDKRHTFLELKIRATNQINGTVDNLSALCTSALEVYDDSTGTWSRELTNNPAWVLTDLLIGEINKKAVGKNRLDLDSIVEWADYCDEIPPTPPTVQEDFLFPRHTSNFVLDFDSNLKELINQIGGACQASLNIVDGKYGVLIDKKKTVPVQVFTPRNYSGFNSSRTYTESPDAVEIKFNDPSKNYQLNTVVVYDDGFDETNASNIDTLETFGISNQEQAWRFGRYMMAQNRLRQENISIRVDFEHLAVTRGDYVQFTQDAMRVGGRPARVSSVSGSTITIDDGIDTDPLENYGYVFRDSTGTIVKDTLTVVNSDTFTVDGTVPSEGDLIVIGIVDSEVFDCIVKAITPADNLTASILLVEKADGVFDALETGETPDYVAGITQGADVEVQAPGEVENLQVVDTSYFFDSDYNYYVDLEWEAPIGAAYEIFEVYVDNGTGYNLFDSTKKLNYRYIVPDEADLGVEHKFKVLAVSSSGLKLNLGEVGFVTATPERKTTRPSDVEDLNINITNQVIQLSWAPVEDDDIKDYLIRYNPTLEGTWFNSIPLTRVDRFTSSTSVQARVGTYLIKALDFAGNESAAAALAITSIPELLQLNLIEEINDFPALTGSKDKVEDSGSALTLQLQPTTDYYPDGIYYFSSLLDLGKIYTVRLQSLIEAEGFTESDLMSSWTTLDSVSQLSSTTTAEWDVKSEVRYKSVYNVMGNWQPLSDVTSLEEGDIDDWTNWKEFTMGDFTGRIFQFRLKLFSYIADVTPRVLDGTIRADMPDRIAQDDNLTSDVNGTDITYDPAFKGPGTTPLINITQDDAQQGDYYKITNKTLEGFTITFYDSTDTAVVRTFDWLAKGFGQENVDFI